MTSEPQNTSARRTFSQVVEQLEAVKAAPSSEYGPGSAVSSGAAAQPQHEPAYVSPNALSQIYENTAASFGPSAPRKAPAEPVVKPSVKPQDIARELKLRIWHSAGQILEIRRRFAMTNHPDRVSAAIRDAATVRMSIANMLIDEALRERETRT